MFISKLYKIDNEVVFYSPKLTAVRDSYYNDLISGNKIGYDVNGNTLSANEAGALFMQIRDYKQSPPTLADQIYRNMSLANVVIAVVKEELITTSAPLVYLDKLSTVIALLQTGSFDTAAVQLLAMIPDDVITDEQLQRWASYCTSADAIEVT